MQESQNSRWLAWSLVTFFYAYQYVLRVMPSILMEDIVKKFSLSPESFGQFSGVYYLGYSLMHLPVGIFLDRFGPRKVLPFLIACTSLGLLPILYADSFIYPIIGRIFIGIGSSGAILGVFKVLHLYFEPLRFSRYLSIAVTIGLLGALYGGAPVHFLRERFGFELVVFALLIVSLVLAGLSYLFLKDSSAPEKTSAVFGHIKSILSNKMVLIFCLISGFMVGPLEGFADVWGVQFLKIFHGLADGVAAGLPSWLFIGMAVGGPIICLLFEKTQKPLPIVFATACTMAIAFILLLSVQLSALTLSILFFVVGVCCGYQALLLYQVSILVKESEKTMSSVIANMIVMIFGYFFHTSIGKCISWIAAERGIDGFYDAATLASGIAMVPLGLVISIILLAGFLYRERKS